MGIWHSTLINKIFPSGIPCKILMLGLDHAGKTTLLYKLKLGKVVTTISTMGFNVETVEYKDLSFTIWDVGGGDKIKALLHHYFPGTHGIIYVVDSMDSERMDEAKMELETVLEDDRLKDAALLVFANKQDLPGALTTSQIADKLQLYKQNHRHWSIQATCALTGEGMVDGLEWMANTIKIQQ